MNQREVALGFLAECRDDLRIPLNAEERAARPGVYPYWGANSVQGYVDAYLVDGPTVLLGEDGAPFFDRTKPVAFFVDEPIWPNNHVHVLKPRTTTHGRWLMYALNAVDYSLYVKGSTRHKLNQAEMMNIRLPWIEFDRQRKTADYLDSETVEIDAVLRTLNTLDEALRDRAKVAQARAVFGLAEGQRHSAADAHSPLSGIPEHWGRTKFGYDFTESTERNRDGTPGPLLSISEYRGVELNTRTEGQQASLDVSKYRVVRPGQLAANMMWLNHGGLGVSCLDGHISPDYKAFWISDRFEPRYVHHLFRSSRYIDYFAAVATGVRPNAQRVTKTVLDATPVPLPPLDEQIRIADELDEATTRVDAMLAKVADLKSLLLERRAALITDVVTGKKEVS
ncbi:restriction endonuclease subunit S [Curtobacterium flaccumfaciens pv. flaccumfaciens]|uniref:restriction endonuclease subunit S n=1 Tax=Curtobacterium flaccumfaciens TaxID=2035 RepID=UPI00217DFC70|nr:restriction endonuclease subunit S [Curtobacterium flaccumfaciens]MCS6547184.1 restriction endonuclease subunit S [Curtobacterium flaccumfaciens pv. flaccumfaciens]